MSFIEEFKAFALKGNVVDMAVGVVIGGAFGKIVSSLVDNVVMPPIGMLTGGINFTSLEAVLKPATTDATGAAVAAVTLKYGAFIQTVFDFTIVALAIFTVIKLMNNLRKTEAAAPEAPATPPAQEVLLTEIRDLLKASR